MHSRFHQCRAERREAHGFTLIEVLVALAVVAVAFVALLGVHNQHLAIVARNQDLTRATLLARQLVTRMELVEEFPDLGFASGEFENFPGFLWEREVTEVEWEGILLEAVRRVDFRIIWDERIPDACRLVYFIRDRREPEQLP